MKKLYLMTLMLLSCIACWGYSDTGRQKASKTPAEIHRTKGYRGSVAITDQCIVWIGFDSSHGYMFNQHHYMGAGAGLTQAI